MDIFGTRLGRNRRGSKGRKFFIFCLLGFRIGRIFIIYTPILETLANGQFKSRLKF